MQLIYDVWPIIGDSTFDPHRHKTSETWQQCKHKRFTLSTNPGMSMHNFARGSRCGVSDEAE